MNSKNDSPKLPVLFDDERSPDARKVRLAIMSLDLDVEVRPCPPGGERFRAELERLGGTAAPLLSDESHDFVSADPDAIVRHLRANHASAPATDHGTEAGESELELFAYETCPFCAMVRDVLAQLELPYTARSMGPGSRKRDEFRARYGKTQFPFLRDSSGGVELFESMHIIRHLRGRGAE